MTPLVFGLLCLQDGRIDRDVYGVPAIKARSFADAFYLMGKAVAEDRLWQMENSRRTALGRSAEILGPGGLTADKQTLQTGYTDEEYAEMFAALPEKARTAFQEYAKGVNATIEARKAAEKLPPGYKENGISPEPWTVKDSMAITVLLSRRFGTGGAGELRNLALYLYLQTQPSKDKVLDVLDDLAWQNDPKAVCTVSASDDPLAGAPPTFPAVTREQTRAHLAALPKVSIFELLPAIRVANGDDSRLIAQTIAAPFETGSYCIAVNKRRSATNQALLLSGPQMGFTNPSIIHEVALDAPGVRVAGIDVPGIPAVVIGNTPNFAWGLTTGVADIADIVYSYRTGKDEQIFGTETRPIRRFRRTIKVKGGKDEEVEVVRTDDGPVVLESRGTNSLFSQRMTYWKKEAASWARLYDLYEATMPARIHEIVSGIAMNMNFFFATTDGEIGWRYLGHVPVRQGGHDPRFPMPSSPATEWKGVLPPSKMPHVDNPKDGLIANWNNKPVAWWPNFDTPVWGEVFRNSVLLESLQKPKLAPWDLERAVWDVARKDTDTNGVLAPYFQKAVATDTVETRRLAIESFDGWAFQNSAGATLYSRAVLELKKLVFMPHTGNFTSESYFDRIAQPSVLLKALQGRTTFDFLAGRKVEDLCKQAVDNAFEFMTVKYGLDPSVWPSNISAFGVTGEQPVFYSNRGTYIQITEMSPSPFGRSVAPPGVSEDGEAKNNQVGLARQWMFKRMYRFVTATEG